MRVTYFWCSKTQACWTTEVFKQTSTQDQIQKGRRKRNIFTVPGHFDHIANEQQQGNYGLLETKMIDQALS